jgi:hypothetical protein
VVQLPHREPPAAGASVLISYKGGGRAENLEQVNEVEAKRVHLAKLAAIRKAKQDKARLLAGEQFDPERLGRAIRYLKEHPER